MTLHFLYIFLDTPFRVPISYRTFQKLPFNQQLPLVWTEGVLTAKRWQADIFVAIYLMNEEYFCEVYQEQNRYTMLRVQPLSTLDFTWREEE